MWFHFPFQAVDGPRTCREWESWAHQGCLASGSSALTTLWELISSWGLRGKQWVGICCLSFYMCRRLFGLILTNLVFFLQELFETKEEVWAGDHLLASILPLCKPLKNSNSPIKGNRFVSDQKHGEQQETWLLWVQIHESHFKALWEHN